MPDKLYIYSKNCVRRQSSSSSESDDSEKYIIKNNTNKCCKKMLYSIGAWADNAVTEINFIPKNGIPISWIAPLTLTPSSPTNINHWNMQSPKTFPTFPIFPLEINAGDKFIFKYSNDSITPNAFACAANIDGVIYRTANNQNNTLPNYPNKITLETITGFILVNPSYMITTDIQTRNIIDSINYISISPNITTIYTLIWKL